jgi:hypothetical protein
LHKERILLEMATNLRAMTINMMTNWKNPVHPKPPRRYNPIDDRCWDGGFKVEIPELNNDMNGIGFIDCSSTGERVFDMKDVPIYDSDFDNEVEVSSLSYSQETHKEFFEVVTTVFFFSRRIESSNNCGFSLPFS